MKGTAGAVRWRRLGGAAVAAFALAACSSQPTPVVQAKVPSTTIGGSNPYAVPSHITPAYIQGVLNALDAVDGDAARLIVAKHALVKPALQRLEAIDSKSWFTEDTDTWIDDLAAGLRGYRPNPGNRLDKITRVVSASTGCVFVAAQSNFSAISTSEPRTHINYIELLPSTLSTAAQWNPTPWVFGIEGWNSSGLTPSNPCGSSG